jgi:arylsulfatase
MNPAWDDLGADRRADLARRMAVFAAMVDRMDQTIGRVVADLERHGELDNTLILFLSDNGACAEWDPFGFDGKSGPENVLHTGAMIDTMGGPGSYMSYGSGWANAGNTPFRMYKHDCHEGGIRTPLIVHWPRSISDRGAYRDQVGHIIDVMATLVDVARATYPAKVGTHEISPMEGTSLVPAFHDKTLARDLLAWEHEGNRAARVGDWKIVSESHEGGAWHLFNVKADPVEQNDLAATMPEKVKELAARWDAWAERCHVVTREKPNR